MRHKSGTIRIGISGWRYAPWRGLFYPPGLPQRRELAFASRHFPSIELNGSFYSLQTPQSYARWYAETPPGFVFAVKGSRYLTHLLQLNDIDKALPNFFASGLFELREKLGPLCWQLPPRMRYDPEKLERFFDALPRSTAEALALARRHDARTKGRVTLEIDADRPLRHAVEVRHESFVSEDFVRRLRRHRIAAVFADTAQRWPYFEDLTADFAYVRLHGDAELYVSGYGEAALDRWAERIQAWSRGCAAPEPRLIAAAGRARGPLDVYCYFDNDSKVKAPVDARSLMRRLGLSWAQENADEEQAAALRRRLPRRPGQRAIAGSRDGAAARRRRG